MIERVNAVLKELHTQLVVEIANGRDVYFGPGFQAAVGAFSKMWLAGDVTLVLQRMRGAGRKVNRVMNEQERQSVKVVRTAMCQEELAPKACIVCGCKPAKGDGKEWFYLAGSKPAGALVCSKPCLDAAVQRSIKTGRVDR